MIIDGKKKSLGSKLVELWEYRDLMYFLIWHRIRVRYKQTLLGTAWALLQPVLNMIIFTFVFGRLIHVPSEGLPYPAFALCALLPWQFFANALSESSRSLLSNQNLLTKVYFPRFILPIAGAASGIVDFGITFVLMLGLLAWYGLLPGIAILLLPFFMALALLFALAIGLWFAALNVRYRDLNHTLPVILQLWLFASPIAYPSRLVPARWQAIYSLNPMASVIDGFRWALLGLTPPSIPVLAISFLLMSLLLVSGLSFFNCAERTFADTI